MLLAGIRFPLAIYRYRFRPCSQIGIPSFFSEYKIPKTLCTRMFIKCTRFLYYSCLVYVLSGCIDSEDILQEIISWVFGGVIIFTRSPLQFIGYLYPVSDFLPAIYNTYTSKYIVVRITICFILSLIFVGKYLLIYYYLNSKRTARTVTPAHEPISILDSRNNNILSILIYNRYSILLYIQLFFANRLNEGSR